MSEQPSITTWVPKWEPWDATPETLADVPDGVDVIASPLSKKSLLFVVFRQGSSAFYRWGNGAEEASTTRTKDWQFIRYLDPQPEQPLTLEKVPDGRVVKSVENRHLYWKHCGRWLCTGSEITTIEPDGFGGPGDFTITNWVMELATHNPQ